MAIPRQASNGFSIRSNGSGSRSGSGSSSSFLTISGRSFQSPLTQLRVGVEQSKDEALKAFPRSHTHIPSEYVRVNLNPPPPALELNLFRRDSTYSIDSLSTLSTVSTDDVGVDDEYATEASVDLENGNGSEDGNGSAETISHVLNASIRIGQEVDSPTTPKAVQTGQSQAQAQGGYFAQVQALAQAQDQPHAEPSKSTPSEGLPRSTSGPELTPKRSFVVRSRTAMSPGSGHQGHAHGRTQIEQPAINLSLPTRTSSAHVTRASASTSRPRSVSKPERPAIPIHSILPTRVGPSHQPERLELSSSAGDRASMYGEQGEDWGEDEDTFEWVDTYGVKQEVNGNGVSVMRKGSLSGVGLGSSPTKRLARLKAAVESGISSLPGTSASANSSSASEATRSASAQDGREGRKVRRQLTFARRAPPPPPPSAAAHASTDPSSSAPPLGVPRPGLKKALSLAVHPTRVNRSQRSPPAPLQPSNSQPSVYPRPPTLRSESLPHPSFTDPTRSAVPFNSSSKVDCKPEAKAAQTHSSKLPKSPKRYDLSPGIHSVPLKDAPLPSPRRPRVAGDQSRASNISFQSAAYSFYDLDAAPASAKPSSLEGSDVRAGRLDKDPQTVTELAFPEGKYSKVKISTLEAREKDRERKHSDRSIVRAGTIAIREDGSGKGKSPEDCLNAGIEARGQGELAKSAWYFMQAAEGGSVIGRMYWGLALRHGWGIAKDEARALSLLRQACEETIGGSETTIRRGGSGMELQQSPGSRNLSTTQKKEMTKDLSLGLFEIANCFLDGSGTKKAPEVALSYLRLAGNMGDLASQEQLGFLLSKGTSGVKKDMKEAAKWYRMAIDQGSSNTFGLAWVWKEKYMD